MLSKGQCKHQSSKDSAWIEWTPLSKVHMELGELSPRPISTHLAFNHLPKDFIKNRKVSGMVFIKFL